MFDLADGYMGIACFAAGTRILTPYGEREVEALALGDSVVTVSGMVEPCAVDRLPRHRLQSPSQAGKASGRCGSAPMPLDLASRRAISFSRPTTRFTGEGVLIPLKYLVNGSTVVQLARAHVIYYHIELRRHDVILAEGLAAETYLESGDRRSFTNGGAVIEAHAHFGPADADAQLHWAAQGYAPLVVTGPVLERQRALLERNALVEENRAKAE